MLVSETSIDLEDRSMTPSPEATETRLLIGLLEYDGSLDPVVLIGMSYVELYREAVGQVQFTDERGLVRLVCDDFGWLAVNPFPDTDDVAAMAAWFDELGSSDELNDQLRFTVYGPPGSGPIAGRPVTRWRHVPL